MSPHVLMHCTAMSKRELNASFCIYFQNRGLLKKPSICNTDGRIELFTREMVFHSDSGLYFSRPKSLLQIHDSDSANIYTVDTKQCSVMVNVKDRVTEYSCGLSSCVESGY